MSFVMRGVEAKDLNQLYNLAKQFVLLNLPAEKKVLAHKIETSEASFRGNMPKEKAEYLFVIEDVESKTIVGSSQVIAKHGTPESPHYAFKVLSKNRVSKDLGIGFIHKILRFYEETDGPTEIGGLVVDRAYRGRSEKVGKQVSLVRFLYIAMRPEAFEARALCELTPPLTEEGRSEFWEALGRRFTGLPYLEADQLSQLNKDFISDLFPEEDIYMSLLDSKARLVLGRVGQSTEPARHLLEAIGFKYLEEVDPFDGGPHYGAMMQDISVVRQSHWCTVGPKSEGPFSKTGLVGLIEDGKFRAQLTALKEVDGMLLLPEKTLGTLKVRQGDKVCVSVIAEV